MTKTPTPTMTKTPTNTPTPTMTPTPTKKSERLFYVYKLCGTLVEEGDIIIQPFPAIPGNVIGNVILYLPKNECWELVDIGVNQSQLQNTWGGTLISDNYFIDVFPTPFVGNNDLKPCKECKNKIIILPPKGDCTINLRNWSDCKESDASGVIYVNANIVYSFNSTFNANVYLDTLQINNGDIVKIILTPAVNNSIVTLNVGYNNAETYSQTTDSTNEIMFVYEVKCFESFQHYIDIYSTCKENTPSITLYSNSYTEGAPIPPGYYSNILYGQPNNSPDMTWILNSFDTSNVLSYDILCEDIDAFGYSPDGYFIHWRVTDIDPNQLTIGINGSWISGNVQPTDFGFNDNSNGWNGPCPPGSTPHNYRIQITANLVNGSTILSNYSNFTAACFPPVC
jgi:phosphatidylethanolamine-binding protein (PEBP) family uncharacterized protein